MMENTDSNSERRCEMKLVGVTLVTLVGSVLLFSMPAWSDSKGKKDKEADTKITDLVKDATITIEQAIKTATEKVQGTVVEAELEKEHGKTVWEVEVLGADGHVMQVHIDAASGEVIDTEMKEEKKKEAKKGKK
jgi:uncharacterized membrane protein YkoI